VSTIPPQLVSQLLKEDPELRDIVEEFVDGLQSRLDELQNAFDANDWDQLATLAHRLKGASGSYGYPDLSALAATMESSFRAQQAGNFRDWLRQFEELVSAAKAGL
jgi:HPt (histidine-containing phosphotransfer) domain-containing protein